MAAWPFGRALSDPGDTSGLGSSRTSWAGTGTGTAPCWAEALVALWTSRRAAERRFGSARSQLAISGQASSHRSLQAMFRKATMGSTFRRSQCIPAPFSLASTTSLLALSTIPLPMGYPAATNSAYLI